MTCLFNSTDVEPLMMHDKKIQDDTKLFFFQGRRKFLDLDFFCASLILGFIVA